MKLETILPKEGVLDGISAKCGRQMLEVVSKHASKITGLDATDIFDGLLDRERLGSTAVGKGAAIPHTRMRDLKNPLLMFARLKQPVAMDAPDDQPVDLVFCLLVPEQASGSHLKALARVSRFLSDPIRCEHLRSAASRDDIYSTILNADAPH